jgi:hypothetical protein
MSNTINPMASEEQSDASDTLSVPPPNFRERLASAQRARARANGTRPVLHTLNVEKQPTLQPEQVPVTSNKNE